MLLIVKIGGNVVDDPQALQAFLQDFAALPGPKILVHGGGKIATEFSKRLGIVAQMHEGRRITDEATLQVVTMVYAGWVNKQIVSALQALGCPAAGFTGADMDLIRAAKRPPVPFDYGFAGDVQTINQAAFQTLLESGVVPVLAPITHDGNGQLLNTNADTIASEVAKGLSKRYDAKLLYCFEKAGVLTNVNDDASYIPLLQPDLYQTLLADGTIAAGMKPKLENCFAALKGGVSEVIILHASRLATVAQAEVVGTRIVI